MASPRSEAEGSRANQSALWATPAQRGYGYSPNIRYMRVIDDTLCDAPDANALALLFDIAYATRPAGLGSRGPSGVRVPRTMETGARADRPGRRRPGLVVRGMCMGEEISAQRIKITTLKHHLAVAR